MCMERCIDYWQRIALKQRKTTPAKLDEPTFARWVPATTFLAFVSTDTNLHSTRNLRLPIYIHRSIAKRGSGLLLVYVSNFEIKVLTRYSYSCSVKGV